MNTISNIALHKQHKNIAVIGVGNLLSGSDGRSSFAMSPLLKAHIPDGIKILQNEIGNTQLFSEIAEASHVFLLDAVEDNKVPGTITMTYPQFSHDYPPTVIAHNLCLRELIAQLFASSKTPLLVLFTISIPLVDENASQMNKEIANVMPRLLNGLNEVLERFVSNEFEPGGSIA